MNGPNRWWWARPRAAWLSLAACVVLFSLYPALDLHVSRLFYDSAAGEFYWRATWPVELARDAVKVLIGGWCAWLALAWSYQLATGSRLSVFTPRTIVYLYLVLLIGPLLVVNQTFKAYWGRARPFQIREFGGSFDFTPALVPHPHGPSNGSFPSGHASAGFYFVALAFVLRRHRRAAFAAAVVLGSLIGLARIVHGKHFLSDIVFAFYVDYFVARWVYHLLYPRGLCM